MTFTPTYGRIWRISYPLIVAGVSETIVEVTDTVFLARYGVTELAAIGLAAAIYGIALALIYGFVDGIQILLARRAGEGRDVEVGRVFNQGLYLLVLAAVVLILVIKLAVPALTAELFASAAVHAAVDDYLQIYAVALVFEAVNLAYSVFYVGIARTRVLIGAAAVLAVTNILLDYLLIFGRFGFPELGIQGAAIASLAAEAAAFVFLSIDVVRRGYVRTYGLLRFGSWDRRVARLVGFISVPVSLEALLETIRWFVFFVIIEQLGEDLLAKANIVYSIYAVLLIPVDGFSETVCSMVSHLIGQRRAAHIATLMRRAVQLSYAIVAPLLLVVVAFPGLILAVFSSDQAFTVDVVPSLFVICVAAVILVPAETAYAAVAGTGDTRAILFIQAVMTSAVIGTAWYAGIVRGLALEYVWAAEILAAVIALVLSAVWLKSGIWQRLRI